jgi:hypothetical protein
MNKVWLLLLFSIAFSDISNAQTSPNDVGLSGTTFSLNGPPALECQGVGHTPGWKDCRSQVFVDGLKRSSTFRLFSIDDITHLLNATSTDLEAKQKQDRETLESLRNEVHTTVTTALQALPSQLFTKEIKETLVTEISAQLQATLDQRIDAMKQQIETDVIAKVMQSLKTMPH